MSSEQPASDRKDEAKRRADARKAKILARGNSGLARLANTARGEEGSKYIDVSTPIARTNTPPASESSPSTSHPRSSVTDRSSRGPSTPAYEPRSNPINHASNLRHSSSLPQTGSPDEEYRAQLESMMSLLGGGGGAGGGIPPNGAGNGSAGAMPENPLAAMLAQMSGAGMGGGNDPLGITDGSSGFPGMPPMGGMGMGTGDQSDQMAAMLQAFSSQGTDGKSPQFPSNPFFPPAQSAPKPLLSKLLPLLHLSSIFLFYIFLVFWWEPLIGSDYRDGAVKGNWKLGKYGLLSGSYGGLGDVARERSFVPLPVFWAFVMVEVLLQSTRFLLIKTPVSPPSMIAQFIPLMPPHISRPILMVTRYASILNQVWKDGCLFLFLLGIGSMIGGWRNVSLA